MQSETDSCQCLKDCKSICSVEWANKIILKYPAEYDR